MVRQARRHCPLVQVEPGAGQLNPVKLGDRFRFFVSSFDRLMFLFLFFAKRYAVKERRCDRQNQGLTIAMQVTGQAFITCLDVTDLKMKFRRTQTERPRPTLQSPQFLPFL